jgi:hypothetical protein
MSAERFRQQVEKARTLSPNVEPPRADTKTKQKKSAAGEKESPLGF